MGVVGRSLILRISKRVGSAGISSLCSMKMVQSGKKEKSRVEEKSNRQDRREGSHQEGAVSSIWR